MTNLRRVVDSVISIFLIFLLVSCGDRSKTNIPKVQLEKFEREYSSIDFQKIDSMLYRDTKNLLIPVTVEYSDNKYYISDNRRMKVYIFDKEWGLVDSIGRGVGRGPGEIMGLIDFEVTRKDIWIIDGPNLAIHKFRNDGEYLLSNNFEAIPSRVVLDGDQLVTLNSSPGKLFSEITKEDLILADSFGTLIQDQEMNFMALFGHLESRVEGGFIYIPQHQSLIYSFNKDHEVDFINNRPDGQDFPVNDKTESNSNTPLQAPKSAITAFAADTFGDKLFVGIYSSISDKDYIDVYDRLNGEYIETLNPPFGCVDFEIVENTFTCIERGERVVVYDMVE